MKGVMADSVSAGSSHRGARVTWTAQLICPSGAAPARAGSPDRTRIRSEGTITPNDRGGCSMGRSSPRGSVALALGSNELRIDGREPVANRGAQEVQLAGRRRRGDGCGHQAVQRETRALLDLAQGDPGMHALELEPRSLRVEGEHGEVAHDAAHAPQAIDAAGAGAWRRHEVHPRHEDAPAV